MIGRGVVTRAGDYNLLWGRKRMPHRPQRRNRKQCADAAHHAVLWVSEWTRSQVYPGFLTQVLLSSGIQRYFSLVCKPIR